MSQAFVTIGTVKVIFRPNLTIPFKDDPGHQVTRKLYQCAQGTSYGQIWSVGPEFGFLNKLIRESLLGGPTLLMHRHCEISPQNPTIYDSKVYRTDSGEIYRRLIAYDFNGWL